MSIPNPEMSQGPTPDLQSVTAAYSDILKHNSANTGLGVAFKGMFKGFIESGADDASSSEGVEAEDVYKGFDEKIQESMVEGEMDAELQDIFHGDTFLRAGIRIAPLGQFSANVEGKAVTNAELVPTVQNTSLFTEFLSTLQPGDIQDEGAETFLSDVVANLSKVAGICFDERKHKGLSAEEKAILVEAGEDALRTFATIDPEYTRLGIDGVGMNKRAQSVSKELSDFLGIFWPWRCSAGRNQRRTPQIYPGSAKSAYLRRHGQSCSLLG